MRRRAGALIAACALATAAGALACTPARREPAGAPGSASVASGGSGRARTVVDGVDLTDVGFDRGDSLAPVVVVEFSDFGCPYCAQFATRTAPPLMREFVDSGRVRWKYVPFVAGQFRHGEAAAAAAECAGAQGRFWDAKDALYASQREWSVAADPAPVLARLMAGAGVEARAFARCYATRSGAARTARATAAARRLGVRATPTFFVDGHKVEGAMPLGAFRAGLRRLLPAVRTP